MLSSHATRTQWHRPALILAGLAWLVRGVLAWYGPDYWSPRTPLDYAAVAGTSMALLLLAAGLWGFYQHHPTPPGRAQSAWRVGITVSCASALTISVSNFLEDVLRIEGLGYVWVMGILALLVGLLIAGVSAFWVKGFRWWVGGLLLACAISLLYIERNGLFGMGLALLALSQLKGKPV